MGKEGQTVPEMSDSWINTISGRYIELYEKVIGQKFVPEFWDQQKTNDAIVKALEKLK
jgi:phosphoribosylaminoimidazole-succinocarboxamide synthase